jgi:hypothetical protein
MPNEPNLKIIGKALLNKYKLEQYRKYFAFDFDINFDNFDNFDNSNDPNKLNKTNDIIKNFIRTNLNIDFDQNYIDIIHKKIADDGLNWHIDDCVIVTKKSVRKDDDIKDDDINDNDINDNDIKDDDINDNDIKDDDIKLSFLSVKNKLNINNLFFSEPNYNKERYIKISENKYLYFNNRFNKLPNKTIIFYSSI